jgi:glycosyltransferase involved in cell wall biosynthesis
MKIVMVDTTVHQPPIGGGHLYLPALMKGLIEKGHEVHLVVKGEPDKKIAGLIHDSKAIVHVKPWKKNGLVEDIAPLFADWVNQMAPDIYFISASGDIGWVALPLLNPSVATFTVGHTDAETFYLPARHYSPFLTRAIGVSHEICEHYHTNCGIDRQKIEWIPYGVTVSEEEPQKHTAGPLAMVYVGRVVEEQKRISDIIAIVKLLSQHNMAFELTIVGDGPDMPRVKNDLSREIADGKVKLAGWITNAAIINILKRSEVFLLTSAYEGFCIALVEAMANGCCPLVTDIRSGNKFLVQDKLNGFVLPVGDVKGFAERLKELGNDKNKLNTLRKEAWNTGKVYSITAMTDNYEKSFINASVSAKNGPRKTDASYPLMETCRSKYPKWLRRAKAALKANQ